MHVNANTAWHFNLFNQTLMKKIILGTAGHIDHGKTTLIKALTGTDCDRLKEEKERGITIELGFTSLTLPNGHKAGIVDVPGHEKFVKNMVAGVGGIDAVIMVIAADEGVMPQTREHLDICNLLSIKMGIIALTKADLVDDDWIELVTEEIRSTVKDNFLEDAPVIPVSSVTMSGFKNLLDELEHLVSDISERPSSGIMRLPVDRVFSMKGFGTVITGTLLAGKIKVGDDVEILPGKIRSKVRGVQVHNQLAESVSAGLRTALNFQGLEKKLLNRGDVVSFPGTIVPTRRVDAWFNHLKSASRPLKNRTRVRFHSGTSEIFCRVILPNSNEILPGQSGFIHLVLETPAVILPHDRYVLRSYSPVDTVGGGEILDNLSPKQKRFSDSTIHRFEILKSGDVTQALLLFCNEAGPQGLEFSQILARCGLEEKKLAGLMDSMISRGLIVMFSKKPRQISIPGVIKKLKQELLSQLKAHHARHPLKQGLLKEELRIKLPKEMNPRLYSFIIEELVKKNMINITREFLSLPEHKPVLKDSQKNLRDNIFLLYKNGGRTPPTRKELIEKLKVQSKAADSILGILVREGGLVKLNEEIFYEAGELNRLVGEIKDQMEKNGEITIKDCKDVTGLSRKFMIPVFEYLDRSKITLRMGDKRVLRK